MYVTLIVDAEPHEVDLVGRITSYQGFCVFPSHPNNSRRVDIHQNMITHSQRSLRGKAQWLAGNIGDTSAEASILITFGAAFTELRDFVTAESYCRQAVTVILRIRYVAAGAQICAILARLRLAQDNPRDALQYARQSATLYRRTNQAERHADALEFLADIRW